MLPNIKNTGAAHQFRIAEDNSVTIEGYAGINYQNCFCIVAEGSRYHEHGISTGSVLLCCKGAKADNGDLVLVKEKNRLAIYRYFTDPDIKSDGEKRILHDASVIHAKVLSSFNFYQ